MKPNEEHSEVSETVTSKITVFNLDRVLRKLNRQSPLKLPVVDFLEWTYNIIRGDISEDTWRNHECLNMLASINTWVNPLLQTNWCTCTFAFHICYTEQGRYVDQCCCFASTENCKEMNEKHIHTACNEVNIFFLVHKWIECITRTYKVKYGM